MDAADVLAIGLGLDVGEIILNYCKFTQVPKKETVYNVKQ